MLRGTIQKKYLTSAQQFSIFWFLEFPKIMDEFSKLRFRVKRFPQKITCTFFATLGKIWPMEDVLCSS